MKTSSQPVCPTDEGRREVTWDEVRTVGRMGQTLDLLFMKVLKYSPCFVGTGIVVVDEDVLDTGGWMLIFHLPNNFGWNCLGVVRTSECALLCQNFNLIGPL